MALNGIQIFKLTPKKNCKECGCPTCMAFSMKVAQGAMKIEQCPHMSAGSGNREGDIPFLPSGQIFLAPELYGLTVPHGLVHRLAHLVQPAASKIDPFHS